MNKCPNHEFIEDYADCLRCGEMILITNGNESKVISHFLDKIYSLKLKIKELERELEKAYNGTF